METASLARRLGLWDATALGVGSMLGAGVFVAFGPAARAAGGSLLPALIAAAVVAYCNASASAQLASRYPASGGTYVYGRKRLGEWAGFLAGWGFVTGKTASCAAMALTFGLYLAPGASRQVAVAAVVVLTGVNLMGISRTALLTKLLLVPTIAALILVIAVGLAGTPHLPPEAVLPVGAGAPAGVLQAAGLLFFAFAGYARIATLGEEVRRPERTIPLAILLALATAVGLYALVALALLHRLGAAGIAASPTPLLAMVDGGPGAWIVGVGAVTGSLGALLALVAGVGRTTLAMARERDLPMGLARIGSRTQVPVVAELSVAVVVIALLLSTDVLTIVGFSSFGVLVYYAIANAAAFTLPDRPWHAPRWLNVLGFAGCAVLAFTLPGASVLTMVAILAGGCLVRWLVHRHRR